LPASAMGITSNLELKCSRFIHESADEDMTKQAYFGSISFKTMKCGMQPLARSCIQNNLEKHFTLNNIKLCSA